MRRIGTLKFIGGVTSTSNDLGTLSASDLQGFVTTAGLTATTTSQTNANGVSTSSVVFVDSRYPVVTLLGSSVNFINQGDTYAR